MWWKLKIYFEHSQDTFDLEHNKGAKVQLDIQVWIEQEECKGNENYEQIWRALQTV